MSEIQSTIDGTSGDAVLTKSTSKAPWSTVKNIESDYRGIYPESYYQDIPGSVTAQVAATLATLTGLTSFDALALDVFVLTGTTPAIKFYPSFDGISFSSSALAITDMVANANIAGGTGITTIAAGAQCLYMIALPVKCRSLRIDYTASVAGNASIRGGMWKR